MLEDDSAVWTLGHAAVSVIAVVVCSRLAIARLVYVNYLYLVAPLLQLGHTLVILDGV